MTTTIAPKLVSAALGSAAKAGWSVAAGRIMRTMLLEGDVGYEACVSLGSHGIAVDVLTDNESQTVIITPSRLIIGF